MRRWPDPNRLSLKAAGVPDPAGDLRRLYDAAYALGNQAGPQTRDSPNETTTEMLAIYLSERLARRPVSQILGRRAFWRHDFLVTSDVLDPRPETETLVAAALEQPFHRVLDLGTGSGCILLCLLADRPGAVGSGTDISDAALRVAARNASALGLSARATLLKSHWFSEVQGRFDLIVSNPPYIALSEMPGLAPEVREWEPHLALTDGADGLSAYRAIAAGAPAHLTPGGRLLVEVGATQAETVFELFAAAGLVDVAIHSDMDNRERVVSGQRPLTVT